MLNRPLQTCVVFLTLSSVALAQYQEFYTNYLMEGQSPFVDGPAGLEDPSFEFSLLERPSQEKIFVSKNFETNDLTAVQSLTRSWIGTPDEERVLGRKFMRINGRGCFANWFPIPDLYPEFGSSLGHYVTVRAKQDGPFEAIFGINYFDANWNLLQKNSAFISGAESGVSRGDGDLLKKYTLPAYVPEGAVFGQVWIAAPYEDGTTTFDFLNVFTELRSPENARSYLNTNVLRNSGRFVGDFDYYKTGYEFWNAIPGSEPGVKVDFWDSVLGQKSLLLGQQGRITNIYQVFDIQPSQSCTVFLITSPRPGVFDSNALPHARGWFGIDFFDSSANKIDQVVFDISRGVAILGTTHPPVANVDFAIAWFYVEPLFRDEVLPITEVSVYTPEIALATAKAGTTSAKTAAAKTVPAKTKASTKRFVPRSPITPAIALQAKASLSSTETQPVTKPAPKKPAPKKAKAK